MNCYLCHEAPGPGGTSLGVMSAVGICKGCGIGLCPRHGQRSPRTGVLFCPDCGRTEQSTSSEEYRGAAARSA
jgi:hypothetical protein